MNRRPLWGVAAVGTAAILALYALVFIPAYRACRADRGSFWTCAHWLVR